MLLAMSAIALVEDDMVGRERGERLQIMLSQEELAAVDDFRFKNRMPSRASAIREVLRRGLAVAGASAKAGAKSGDFGVLTTKARRPRA
jgi:metal-responsive CopG/Arc/MetJ family transcriptional regulator